MTMQLSELIAALDEIQRLTLATERAQKVVLGQFESRSPSTIPLGDVVSALVALTQSQHEQITATTALMIKMAQHFVEERATAESNPPPD
jgi:hypothetical protein